MGKPGSYRAPGLSASFSRPTGIIGPIGQEHFKVAVSVHRRRSERLAIVIVKLHVISA
jgi:hypothetical protein